MLILPPALAAMGAYPQFILYRAQDIPGKPGKTDKLPVNWQTGKIADAHDRSIWTSAGIAAATAEMWGAPYGIGFVFTDQDPFWFFDIDDCLQADNTWSPLAIDLCTKLAGAAVEISRSGRGLHLFGTGTAPSHGCKNVQNRLEFYTTKRFAALTGAGAQGDSGADLTLGLASVIQQYFPLSPGASAGANLDNWTDEPCAAWSGPEDDDKLIEAMLSAAKSAAASFGGKASPQDLWEGNTEALAKAFPDPNRPFDASSADAALAQHLSFWTGNDCARIDRLMRRSALARDKWDDRGDYYLPRTIIRACAMQGARVLSQRPRTPAPAGIEVGVMLPSDLESHFAGCIHIEEPYVAAAPDGSLLTPQQFRASNRFGGREFPMTIGGRPTKDAWLAFAENCTGYKPPFANRICFRPELPSRGIIDECGVKLYNSYVPIETPCVEGDPSPFLNHLRKLLPSSADANQLLAYMASLVQNPGVKFQWAPLIQGTEGNGKTILIECVIQAVGMRYAHMPKASDLSNKFNAWLQGRLFVGIEEIYVREKWELVEILKDYLTNRRADIQGKGENQVTLDNRANFMLCSNHRDAVPIARKGRRYGIFYTAQQDETDLTRDGMGEEYFNTLFSWLNSGGFAIVTHFLKNMDIPVALDPARGCHRAPLTSGMEEAIQYGMGTVEQHIQEALAAEEIGFRGGFISSTYLQKMLQDSGLRNKALGLKRDELMKTLGFVVHPALVNGWTNNPVSPDFKKARLWVRKDSILALNVTSAAEVARLYSAANDQAGSAGFGTTAAP